MLTKNSKKNKRVKHSKGRGKITKKVCAPKRQNDSISCFSKQELLELIVLFNNKIGNNKVSNRIFPNKTKDEIQQKSRKQLYKALETKFTSKCKNERCLVENIVKGDKFNHALKPKYPKEWFKDENTWLNTYDIENVLNQYQDKYKDFLFLGAVPIDFDSTYYNNKCIVNDICKLSIKNMKQNGYTKLGIVFNLDKHDQPGSHWVALYCDFKIGTLNFFDSYGMEAPKEVITLMQRLQKQNEKLGISTTIQNNHTEHQRKNSECGMYCIYFIVMRLEGKEMKYFTKRIDDDDVEKKRTIFFFKEV